MPENNKNNKKATQNPNSTVYYKKSNYNNVQIKKKNIFEKFKSSKYARFYILGLVVLILSLILVLSFSDILKGGNKDNTSGSNSLTTSNISNSSNSSNNNSEKDGTNMDGFDAKTQVVAIEMEDGGIMRLEMYPDKAPITVANFIGLVKDGFYSGLKIHRIIPGFMIQGGDSAGTGKTAKTIKGEFKQNGVTTNDIIHVKGIISMARTSAMDSASSQFFLMHGTATHLDGAYAGFGKIIEGIDVLDKIAAVKCNTDDPNFPYPLEPQIIKEMRIENR